MQIALVILLAALPTLIWAWALFQGRRSARGPLLLAFFLGTLTVLPILGLQYIWLWHPEWDVYRVLEKNINEVHILALVTLAIAANLEEITKSGVIWIIDRTRIGIQTINDAVKYSILAGLGFSFVENIVYFYYIWDASGPAGLIFPVIFRSIFTMCAHMVFSGIFGYFHGVAKFSRPIMEAKLWMGERAVLVRLMAKFLGANEADAFRQLTWLKGLFIAMMLHTGFNFALEFERFLPVVFIVGGGFTYLLYLLAHKAGAIVFSSQGRGSSMARRDQDVVLELLAMWTKEGRYRDVVDICQRLLMRDPDNKVVQLFQAKAMDNAKLSNLENSFMALFTSEQIAAEDSKLRTLLKQKILMEMLKEKSQAPVPNPVQTSPSSQPDSPSVPRIPSPGGNV